MNPTQLFSDASRVASKLRLALTGATNTGKTYSALLIAYGITKDWSKIAVIDSERRRALFYAERNDLPFQQEHLNMLPEIHLMIQKSTLITLKQQNN